MLRIAAWIGGLALLGLACQALGVDLRGWIEQLLDTVAEISVGYLVLGVALQTVQTGLVALAWVAILIDYLEVPVIVDTLRKVWRERAEIIARIRRNAFGGRRAVGAAAAARKKAGTMPSRAA